jgi:hypothetical protein
MGRRASCRCQGVEAHYISIRLFNLTIHEPPMCIAAVKGCRARGNRGSPKQTVELPFSLLATGHAIRARPLVHAELMLAVAGQP